MADTLTPEKRSQNMAAIRSADTRPEEVVRKYLFAHGLRYRKNVKYLPGKPDIVLRNYKTVVFVNGCFWHRHPGCKKASVPKTHIDYWIPKLNKNVERDKHSYQLLISQGWNVLVIWECEILSVKQRERSLKQLLVNIVKNG